MLTQKIIFNAFIHSCIMGYTPYIMFRFWISWASDVIHVGKGPSLGGNILMSWNNKPDTFPINAVGYTTISYDGQWEMTLLPGNIISNIS